MRWLRPPNDPPIPLICACEGVLYARFSGCAWVCNRADKAEEKDRDHYTSVYADLQTAYKILSDDNTRKQYSDSQQTTDLEFKFADRNVGYANTSEFRTSDGKFDSDAFNEAYSRTDAEQKDLPQLLKDTLNALETANAAAGKSESEVLFGGLEGQLEKLALAAAKSQLSLYRPPKTKDTSSV